METYPLLCEDSASTLQIEGKLIPDIGVMAKTQQTLLKGKHHWKKENKTSEYL